MQTMLERHDALMRDAIVQSGGVVFKTVGDAFCAAFATAPDALNAVLAAQVALRDEAWPENNVLRVRMALHTGTAQERDGDYFGPVLNRVARLLATGYGGQMLLSASAWELARDALPEGVSLLDLGLHRLKDLERPEQVFQVCHRDLPDTFPPLKSLDNSPNNLPQQLTSFIGREKELREVADHIATSRLVTLTGAGGCGKTRLALQSAPDLMETFKDGVWLVELAPLSDPALIVQRVATILRVKEEAGIPLEQPLFQFLQTQKLLLILDNCEHLLSASALLAAQILRACPDVHVLATSREMLGISGELTYRVPPLSLPDPKAEGISAERLSQYEAVRLFIARAILVKPDFTVSNANAPALASICHQLDGIPLAIELAAARVRTLSVEDIGQRLSNRFRLLTGGDRSALPRQQTLRALIDWSYDLLSDAEKTLLYGLSVFVGGWSLAAAEAVCVDDAWDEEGVDVLDVLTSLADKSLVVVAEDPEGVRFRMLETLRQYALEKCAQSGKQAVLRNRHRDWFLALAEEADGHFRGKEQARWLERIDAEHDNLRAALTWCVEQPEGVEVGLRLAGLLAMFWAIRDFAGEGLRRIQALLERSEGLAPTSARALALHGAGLLAYALGDYTRSLAFHQASVTVYQEVGDTSRIASARIWVGNALFHLGRMNESRSYHEENLAIFRASKDAFATSSALHGLANVAYAQGDYPLAQTLFTDGLRLVRECGDQHGTAITLSNLGNIAYMRGDYAEAETLIEESLTLFRELRNQRGEANGLTTLGIMAYRSRHDYRQAQKYFEDGLTMFRSLGDRDGIADTLSRLGYVAFMQGDYAQARVLGEESLALYQAMDMKVRIAAGLSNLGLAFWGEGDFERARSLHNESLVLLRELGDKHQLAETLGGLAQVVLAQGDAPKAVRLWGAAEAIRESIGSPMAPNERASYDAQVSLARSSLSAESFAEQWAAGRALTFEQSIDDALDLETGSNE